MCALLYLRYPYALSVHSWYTFGTLLVHFWYAFGTLLVHFWYTSGTLLVHFWYTFGTLLVKDCEVNYVCAVSVSMCTGTESLAEGAEEE